MTLISECKNPSWLKSYAPRSIGDLVAFEHYMVYCISLKFFCKCRRLRLPLLTWFPSKPIIIFLASSNIVLSRNEDALKTNQDCADSSVSNPRFSIGYESMKMKMGSEDVNWLNRISSNVVELKNCGGGCKIPSFRFGYLFN